MATIQKEETIDYIQHLMQGSGASINYDEIQRELNSDSLASKSDFGTVSLVSNKDSQAYDHSDDISDIPQENFTKSVSNKSHSPQLTPTLSYGFTTKTESESGYVSDQALEPVNNQLAELSSKLERQGFAMHRTLKSVTKGFGMGSVPAQEMHDLVESLLNELVASNQKVQTKVKEIGDLERELNPMKQQHLATKERNSRIIESVRKQYTSKNLDPVVMQVVESYEEKLSESGYSKLDNLKSPITSPDSKSLKIQDLQADLEKVTQERDLLKLKLLASPAKARPGLSTREQIELDKKEHKERTSRFQSWSRDELVSTLQNVLTKLGITDVNQLSLAIDQIVYVYKLLPQMEQVLKI